MPPGAWPTSSCRSSRKVEAERAALATRDRPAVLPADGHEERVILVEESRIGGQVRLDEGAGGLVIRFRRDQPVATEDAPRGLVGDEDRTPRGVKQDGVDRLRPDPVQLQKIPPEGGQRRAPHLVEAPAKPLEEPAGEDPQTASLLSIRSRRPDGTRHLRLGGRNEAGGA